MSHNAGYDHALDRTVTCVRGLVEIQKFQKSELNMDRTDPTHPPLYPSKKEYVLNK